MSRYNNFDLIRLLLAIAVFLFHTAELSQNSSFELFKRWINPAVAVHSFFIVSGFLIFMSYEKSSSLKSYFNKRFRRIAPAYFTVVLLMFFSLSLLSDLSITNYFTSPKSWYFLLSNLSTLNFLHPTLPGLFENNFLATVNGSLWTIKVELMFYLSVPLIAYFYRYFKPNTLLIVLFIFSSIYYTLLGAWAAHYESTLLQTLQHQLPGEMLFFSAGALLYYNFKLFKIYQHLLLFVAFVIFLLPTTALSYALQAIALSIIIIYLGTSLPYLGHVGKHGDLSYGIYIWHFPLIQIFIALELFSNTPWLSFSLLTFLVFTMAWLSWHLVEKPFLSQKSHYVQEEKS